MTFWYLCSTRDPDTHQGYLRRGRMQAVCGVEFSLIRAMKTRGPARPGKPPDPELACPECRSATHAQSISS
jgi:hypothetical protein